MASCGTDALIFLKYAREPIQCLFQPACVEQRTQPPLAIDIAHGLWDSDGPLTADFLHYGCRGEKGWEIIGTLWLTGAGMHDGRGRLGQIGNDVVLTATQFFFVKQKLNLV